jgi:hypothetical protein
VRAVIFAPSRVPVFLAQFAKELAVRALATNRLRSRPLISSSCEPKLFRSLTWRVRFSPGQSNSRTVDFGVLTGLFRIAFCCLRLSRHNVSTGNASCAGSRAGQHGHTSRLWMRSGQDTSWWCLRGQNHQTPSPQVCAMEWRRLPGVALLLSRAITAHNGVVRCEPAVAMSPCLVANAGGADI